MLRPILTAVVDGRLATREAQPREEVRLAALRDNPSLAAGALSVGVSEPAVLATAIELLPEGDARVPLTWAQVAPVDDAFLRWAWADRVPAERIPVNATDPCEYVQAALDARRAARNMA